MSSGITCYTSSTSSICRTYVSISVVFELYGLESTHECDDGLVGCMVAGLLREYQISHGVAKIQARVETRTQV